MVSYRDYLKEIENFTEQNMLDQVIAHSKHILEFFPNSIDALRFLGQAYLEQKKFSEATNCFERLLSFVPDDFVSHVGISSIKEEDRDLDAAIFHMEIAFDSQPSNAIVQEELKRLINKRDGIKPQKINLSRGALIRMYIKGDLYQQALNEIDAILTSSPERVDIQVLQAQVFAWSNSKVQAVEICNRILEHLPYCLNANQILFKIYLENGLTEQASQIQARLISLDPYYKYVTSASVNVEDIPDAKVEIEKLEYTSAFSTSNQEYWSPPDLKPDSSSLTSASQENNVNDIEIPGFQNNSPDLIPDFLSNAGWEKSENPQTQSEFFDNSSDLGSDSPASKSDLPDWLKNYTPTVGFTDGEIDTSAEIQDPLGIINEAELNNEIVSNIEIIPVDNISSISEVEMTADNPEPTSSKDDSSDWMSQFFDEANKSSSEPEGDKGLPDWLKSFGQDDAPAETNSEDEVPDWLKNLDSQIIQNEAPAAQIEQKQENPLDFGDVSSSTEEKSPFSFESEVPIDGLSDPTQDISQPIDPINNENDFLDTLDSLSSENQNVEPTTSEFFDEKIETTQPTSDNSESTLPDWVKSVLSEPDNVTPEIQTPIDSLPDQKVESVNFTPSDFSSTSIPEDSNEASEGAISQDAGDELLEWLRGISPVQSEINSGNEPNNTITADPSSNSEILEDSLNRLEEISGNAPVISQEFPTKSDDNETSPSLEELQPEVNNLSETEPTELIENEQDIEVEPVALQEAKDEPVGLQGTEVGSVVVQEPGVTPTLIEKFQSLLSTSSYSEATSLVAELNSTGFGTEKILETVSSFKNEKINDFEFMQFFGDTLAGFDHFDEAMDVYTQAEKILMGK